MGVGGKRSVFDADISKTGGYSLDALGHLSETFSQSLSLSGIAVAECDVKPSHDMPSQYSELSEQ
jgi:hypothetical protein